MVKKRLVEHECEVKYVISELDEINILSLLGENGFFFVNEYLETDYCPDTEDSLLKRAGLVLRFRYTEGTYSDILLTLKMKGEDTRFQDNFEVEFWFKEKDTEKLKLINSILHKHVEQQLPKEILYQTSIDEVRNILYNIGFEYCRMWSQKKRKIYSNGNITLSFDLLPKDFGRYLEIETNNPSDLFGFIKNLNYPLKKIEKRNYGKLIQSKSAVNNRVCLFEDEEKIFES